MAKSFVDYIGDGSTTIFNISFGYIDRSHVKVYVDNTETQFAWLNDGAVVVVPAPSVGEAVRVVRETPREQIIDFADGETLTEQDLDTVNLQSLYLSQESADLLEGVLSTDNTGNYNSENNRITNLADPVDPQDAVTKLWAETGMTSQLAQAVSAKTAAEAARDATTSIRDYLEGELNFSSFDPTTYYTQARDS